MRLFIGLGQQAAGILRRYGGFPSKSVGPLGYGPYLYPGPEEARRRGRVTLAYEVDTSKLCRISDIHLRIGAVPGHQDEYELFCAAVMLGEGRDVRFECGVSQARTG